MLGSIAVRGSAVALNIVIGLVLARLMGPRGYGVYSFALVTTALFAIPSTAALSTLVVREVAGSLAREERGLVRGVTRWAGRWAVILSLVAAATAALIAIVVRSRLTEESLFTFLIALILVPVLSLTAIRGATLRGLHRVVIGQLPEQIVIPAVMFVALGVVLASGRAAVVDSTFAISLYVGAALFALALAVQMSTRQLPPGVGEAEPLYDTKAWAGAVVPLFAVSGLRFANQELGLLLVGSLAGPSDAGIYRVAGRAAELVSFGLAGINAAIAPGLARRHANSDVPGLRRLVRLGALASLAWAVPVAALLIGFGPWILTHVFGPEYAVGAASMTILCLAQLVNSATGPVGVLLNMTGRERVTARGHGLALTVGVAAGLLLIPRWGVEGAAAAAALSMVTWNVVFVFEAARAFELSSKGKR